MDEWLWYCEFCDKWWDDFQVLACCESSSCRDLLCPECDSPVSDRKNKEG